MANEVYIGIDLGGTRIRAARFSTDLHMQQRTETLTNSHEGFEPILKRIIEQARIVWPTDDTTVLGIGISSPGPLNPMAGLVVSAPNLPGWHNIPLRDILEKEFDVPVYLGNDANLAALAEQTSGAAYGHQDVVFLTISTGIGGGVITGGKLVIGVEGIGAESGHILMVVDGRVTDWEKEAAGPAIGRQAQEAIQRGEQSMMLEMAGGSLETITAKTVGQAAKVGDPLALKIIERAGWMIGLGIVSHLHLFNPSIIVIGGGVAKGTGDLLLRPMWDAIKQYSLDSSYWEHLIITEPTLGEDVSLVGAAALARNKGA
ncbi:MAG: ROK family protein [Anaerolineae bacterium]|nr:ROK family protein [Anaerolineae bacterium]